MSDINYSPKNESIAAETLLLNRHYQIPINTLLTQVFGIAGPFIRRYKVPKGEKNQELPHYEVGGNFAEVTAENVTSSLGTPVHFPMSFIGCDYYKRVKGEITTVQRNTMQLPYTSIATFSRAKRKTVTYMSGVDGAIIEEYGKEAWNIRIQGLIINNERNLTIEQQIRQMQQYEELSDAIQIQGKLFEWLKITQISFDKIDYLPKREMDSLSAIPFEISAMSVEPILMIEDFIFQNL